MQYFEQTIYQKTLAFSFLFCFLWSLSINAYSNEKEKNIDTAFNFSVLIDAKKDAVWPFLFKIDQWKYSVSKLESQKLSGDQEGGVVAVYQNASTSNPSLLIKTLKIIPNQHYSFSIYSYTGRFVGFAAYNLLDEKGKTRLNYSVYLQRRLTNVSDSDAEARRQTIIEGMETRQPKELAALKALVEL